MDLEHQVGNNNNLAASRRGMRLSSLGEEEELQSFVMQKRNSVGSFNSTDNDEIELPEWMSLTGDRVSTIFHILDADHDGRISFEQLAKTLQRYGLPTSDVQSLCEKLDSDKSDDLDADEFAAGVREVLVELLVAEAGDEACGIDIHEYSGPLLKRRRLNGSFSVRTMLAEEASAWSSKPKMNEECLTQPVHGINETEFGVRWFDIHGAFAMKCTAVFFGIHPVAVEDVLSKQQRPKVERYDGFVFFVVPYFTFDDKNAHQKKNLPNDQLENEDRPRYTASNVCIFVDDRRFQDVVTFTLDESSSAFWRTRIRDMLAKSYTRLRESNAQYLTYIMLDTIVDSARPLVRAFRIAVLLERKKIRDSRYSRPLRFLNLIRHDLLHIARVCKHVMRLVTTIIEDDKVLAKVLFYLRDVRDDLNDIEEDLAMIFDECSAIQTEVEKFFQSKLDKTLFILTVITAIFLPLQFLTGVFGMNLHIPESNYKYAYHIFWVSSAVYIISAFLFLRFSNMQKFITNAPQSTH